MAKKWLSEKEATEYLRKRGKLLTVPADGKTGNGNKRWSKERLDKE